MAGMTASTSSVLRRAPCATFLLMRPVGEVRVKVVSSAVNPGEAEVLSGGLVGRFLHARTRPLVLGWDFAGVVDAVGAGVEDLVEGDAVWGHLAYSMTQKQGAYAEYISIPRETLRMIVQQPFDVLDNRGQFEVSVK